MAGSFFGNPLDPRCDSGYKSDMKIQVATTDNQHAPTPRCSDRRHGWGLLFALSTFAAFESQATHPEPVFFCPGLFGRFPDRPTPDGMICAPSQPSLRLVAPEHSAWTPASTSA